MTESGDTPSSKPWLAEFRVMSMLTLKEPTERLHFKHASGLFEAFVSDNSGDDKDASPLVLHILVNAATLEAAEKLTEQFAEKFVHLLTFVCALPFRIARRIHVLEWGPGVAMREGIVYSNSYSSREGTLDELTASLVDTAAMMQEWQPSPTMERALRWFAAGVRAGHIEDQFQYFWFVLEHIAASTAGAPVADKCQTCQGELFCQTCNKVSTHRPFPRQRIEELLKGAKVTETGVTMLFKIRNALLHGSDREEIDAMIQAVKPDDDLAVLVDFIGGTARDIILNHVVAGAPERKKVKPNFLVPSTFVSRTTRIGAHVSLGLLGGGTEPRIADIRLPKVEIVPHDTEDSGNTG